MRLRSSVRKEKIAQIFLIMKDKAICDALRKPPVELPEAVLKQVLDNRLIPRRQLLDLLLS